MMSNFFNELVEKIKDDDTHVVADGLGSAEFTGYIDTGSYILNAVISGSIYGGVPNNKVTAFAGEQATGKTFFALGVVQQFLLDNPDGGVIYFDTEAAVTRDMMEGRDIDTRRVIVSEPDTIQKFRKVCLDIIEKYNDTPEKDRKPMMMVLDSLGQLSSSKEMEDTADGKDTRDMTKAQLIKATFRVINLKLARIGVPLIVTNHVYAAVGSYIPTNEIAGGSGLKYTASTIAMLTKKKDKDGTDVIGNIIKVNMYKSRLSRENKRVEVKLSYKTGLDRYYGLLELAEKYGIFKKVSTRYELTDGSKVFGKTIYEDPEKYFTKEVLNLIDKAAKKEFAYGEEHTDTTVEEEYESSDTTLSDNGE
jgi:RecA/RadA recombinase